MAATLTQTDTRKPSAPDTVRIEHKYIAKDESAHNTFAAAQQHNKRLKIKDQLRAILEVGIRAGRVDAVLEEMLNHPVEIAAALRYVPKKKS